MANYTIEVRRIHENPSTEVFGFNYDFYIDNQEIKRKFEQKFIDHYYFDEIGFETIGKFKHRLRTKLNEIMPYYKQLFETEVAAKDINFLLNKDLTETTSRALDKEDISNNVNNANSTNNNTSIANEGTTFKESSLNNGNATLGMDRLTTINSNDTKMSNNTNTTSNSESNYKGQTKGNEKETITLKSQGNIGITSSAELLQKWREVLINIDQLIINDCKDLFMGVF